MFQFPSNGKARVNSQYLEEGVESIRVVSIPFKRESTCEPDPSRQTSTQRLVSIPFKRESTCELSKRQHKLSLKPQFQFPSNGKARVN